MHLVVLETFLGATVHRLFAVEQVRGRIPDITHIIDAELVGGIVLGYQNVTFVSRFTQFHETYTCIFQNLLHFILMLVADLDNDTRIFCKQNLNDILFLHIVKADFHTAFYVRETHFEQCGNQTTGRYIVSCKDQSFVDKFLYGKECIAEIFSVLYARYIIAYLTQRLGESRTTQFQFVEAEVDMIKCSLFIVDQYRRYNFFHVGNFAACRNNHCSRRNDFLTVRIFLCHRQRVFSGRNIDLQRTAEVAQCFNSCVKAGILTFLRAARPHPVGRQRNAVHAFRHRSPNKVGQCFGYRKDRAGSRIG